MRGQTPGVCCHACDKVLVQKSRNVHCHTMMVDLTFSRNSTVEMRLDGFPRVRDLAASIQSAVLKRCPNVGLSP